MYWHTIEPGQGLHGAREYAFLRRLINCRGSSSKYGVSPPQPLGYHCTAAWMVFTPRPSCGGCYKSFLYQELAPCFWRPWRRLQLEAILVVRRSLSLKAVDYHHWNLWERTFWHQGPQNNVRCTATWITNNMFGIRSVHIVRRHATWKSCFRLSFPELCPFHLTWEVQYPTLSQVSFSSCAASSSAW